MALGQGEKNRPLKQKKLTVNHRCHCKLVRKGRLSRRGVGTIAIHIKETNLGSLFHTIHLKDKRYNYKAFENR